MDEFRRGFAEELEKIGKEGGGWGTQPSWSARNPLLTTAGGALLGNAVGNVPAALAYGAGHPDLATALSPLGLAGAIGGGYLGYKHSKSRQKQYLEGKPEGKSLRRITALERLTKTGFLGMAAPALLGAGVGALGGGAAGYYGAKAMGAGSVGRATGAMLGGLGGGALGAYGGNKLAPHLGYGGKAVAGAQKALPGTTSLGGGGAAAGVGLKAQKAWGIAPRPAVTPYTPSAGIGSAYMSSPIQDTAGIL